VDGARGADRVLVDPEGPVAQLHGRANRVEPRWLPRWASTTSPFWMKNVPSPRAVRTTKRNRLPPLAVELHQVGERRFAQSPVKATAASPLVEQSSVPPKKSKNFTALAHIDAGWGGVWGALRPAWNAPSARGIAGGPRRATCKISGSLKRRRTPAKAVDRTTRRDAGH